MNVAVRHGPFITFNRHPDALSSAGVVLPSAKLATISFKLQAPRFIDVAAELLKRRCEVAVVRRLTGGLLALQDQLADLEQRLDVGLPHQRARAQKDVIERSIIDLGGWRRRSHRRKRLGRLRKCDGPSPTLRDRCVCHVGGGESDLRFDRFLPRHVGTDDHLLPARHTSDESRQP
jgi:hypothetical protein